MADGASGESAGGSATPLEERYELYFRDAPGARPVPLAKLAPTKSPESQPDSVNRAEALMRQAAAGAVERRAPISIGRRRQVGDQGADGREYVVVDGNATYGVALRNGWRAIPAVEVAVQDMRAASPEPELRLVRPPPDEPPFAQCQAISACPRCGQRIVGIACARDWEQAAVRARGEHFERLILHEYSLHPAEPPIRAPAVELGDACIDLAGIRGVPSERRAERLDVRREREWVWVDPVGAGDSRLVPIELAMLRHPAPPALACREPLTTGAAHHSDRAAALARAALELVERDAFMRAATGASTPRRLLSGGLSQRLDDLLERIGSRYRLEIGLFLLEGAIARPTVLAVMIDRSTYGPAVTSGLCCAAGIEEAAEKAILEACQPRVWLRREYEAGAHGGVDVANDASATGPADASVRAIASPRDRGLYWYGPQRLASLAALWRAPSVPAAELRRLEQSDPGDPVAELIAAGPVYSARLPKWKGGGVSVRLLSPALLPLFIDESYSYIDEGRPSLLPAPHFFL